MSEKNKIEELEKKLDETRKILDELIYHFMLRFGDGVVRNSKKQMLKDLKSDNEELIFGKNYYDNLGLGELGFATGEAQEKLDRIIDEMTEEECEIKLNKIFKAHLESIIYEDDTKTLRKLDETIEEGGINYGRGYIEDFLRIIRTSSEVLWSIFEEIKEKKDPNEEQFKKEFMRPYKEKYDEIGQKIEKQRKAEKLAKIREKETELERLKKGL